MPVIQITISQGRSVEQKRELVQVLTRETARIMKTDEEKVRILIYEISSQSYSTLLPCLINTVIYDKAHISEFLQGCPYVLAQTSHDNKNEKRNTY
ncbi:MAG: 4-oxalocrotonate tautomerase family protein [Nitrososphaeraceae archaeon]